jgi:Ca2+-binding EF-hand superfamily protein
MFRIFALAGLAVVAASLVFTPAPAEAAKPKKGDKLEQLFKKLDANNDGMLSPAEFAKLSEIKKKASDSAKKPGKSAKKMAKLFQKLDTNSDGFLSLQEFKKLKEAKNKKAK